MRASKVKNEPVEWLWKDRIPKGMITVVAGRPGGSKSLFSARLARDVSKKGGTVILSCAEDTVKHMTGPRLSANGARKDRIIINEEPQLPADIERIEMLVKRFKVKLMILDPINVHLTEGISRYNDSIRRATTPLKEMCERTGLAVVLVDHVLKNVPRSAHPLSAIGGASSGLSAAARMVYIIGRDPEDKDRIILCNIKTNLRDEPEPFEFAMDEAEVPDFGTMSLLTDIGELTKGYDVMNLLSKPGKGGKAGRPPTKREAACEFLVEYLHAAPNHTMRANDIIEDAKQYGITKRTLEGAKADMEIESVKKQNEWWWKLPNDLIQTLDEST